MTRAELLHFLETVEVGSLESYLSQHGEDSMSALDERMQWAAWNFRDPESASEANFLMQNHDELREVLEEGETAWHLRIKRAEQLAKRAAAASAAVAALTGGKEGAGEPGRPVAQAASAVAPTLLPPIATPPPVRPARPAPPSPVPPKPKPAFPESSSGHFRGAPAPSLSQLETAGKPPPLSELATAIYTEDNPLDRHDPSTVPPARARSMRGFSKKGGASFKKSPKPAGNLPQGLNRTIVDMDTGHTEGLGLGIEKTAFDDDSEPPARQREGRPAAHNPDPPSNATFMMLSASVALAGVGALALAAAIIFGATRNGQPEPTPPGLHDALSQDPGDK